MAPISSAVLLPAAAAVLMAMAALQLSAAATAARPPAPIGQPGCNTTCGNVSVPYPFGFGPSQCYWPGLNLICDTRHHQPRLLLGDGSLQVTEISLSNQTVRVMRTGPIIDTTGDFTLRGRNASLNFGRGFWENGYRLSAGNELVVSGCNVMATIWADIINLGEEATKIVGGCGSFCITRDDMRMVTLEPYSLGDDKDKYCTGTTGCCQAPLSFNGVPVPNGVQVQWLNTGNNHTADQTIWPGKVFVVERGWADRDKVVSGIQEAPLLLDFAVTRGLPPNSQYSYNCSQDVERKICKSEHSYCVPARAPGYACKCKGGYEGNPYLAGGCQDVNECKFSAEKGVCFGVCINKIGSYVCQCRPGTYGDPSVEGGCVNYNFTKDTVLPMVYQGPTSIMPGCNNTCGDVRVPYPFGFGHPGCYLPGFNLTCDTSHSPPRLLLHGNGNGGSTFQVVDISLRNSTLRVVHHRSPYVQDLNLPGVDHIVDEVGFQDIGEPYVLSTRNEFIVISPFCNLLSATLHGYRNGSSNADSIISRAVPTIPIETSWGGYCSGHGPIYTESMPKRVEFKPLENNALTFISEVGLTDQWKKIFNANDLTTHYMSTPIVLKWAVKQGLSASAADNSGKCPADVLSGLCKSDNSYCQREINRGFTCHCSKGYDGNPYVTDGCQDVDECNPELRNPCSDGYHCKNLPGHYKCRNPRGLMIGLLAASGPTLLLSVLGIMFLQRKFKQRRIKAQKQKYFNQNRGQLLQQLLSQKADIAERMIIPLDELAKATSNFDKSREIGGGGHGTVYKGILSDLHVVAIKKSKIAMQKEIDEFINELAILSQINHKNVVKLFGCCLETEVPLLVYEFIPNGTLDQHLHIEQPKRSLSWSNRLRIATEIATSIAYLHSSISIPIIHRDIKSANILLDATMTSKISDFGASRYIPIDNKGLTTRIQGTFGYLDPECFNTGRLTEKSDVYSFGVILVELLTRKMPTCSYLSKEYGGLVPHFLNLLASRKLDQIMDPQVLEEGGTEVQQVVMLAASCINISGEERPTMRQVELTLEGLQQGSNKKYKKNDMVTKEFENRSIGENYPSQTSEGHRFEESSRRYSLEQEMIMSARYPR